MELVVFEHDKRIPRNTIIMPSSDFRRKKMLIKMKELTNYGTRKRRLKKV